LVVGRRSARGRRSDEPGGQSEVFEELTGDRWLDARKEGELPLAASAGALETVDVEAAPHELGPRVIRTNSTSAWRSKPRDVRYSRVLLVIEPPRLPVPE